MAKLPAFQFYPSDWLADAVAGCSIAAQGLWLRMMVLMHGCEPYGYLVQQGEPIPAERIARMCGVALGEYSALLDELDSAGVPSRTSNGAIYSRRMVRDAKQRAQWRKWQKTHRVTLGQANVRMPRHVNVMSMSGASSSSSSSSKQKKKIGSANADTSKRRTRLADDFSLSPEMRAFADERKVRAVEEFAAFCDFHRARGSTMADWRRAWQTWVRNAVRFAAKGSQAHADKRTERNRRNEEEARRYLEDRGEVVADAGKAL